MPAFPLETELNLHSTRWPTILKHLERSPYIGYRILSQLRTFIYPPTLSLQALPRTTKPRPPVYSNLNAMAPTTTWSSLVLTYLSFTILVSPLASSLPILTPNSNSETGEMEIQPRSPIPDPQRRIPKESDLLSSVFATLGMQELNKFNKLHPETHEDEDDAPIDDSNSDTPTVTSHDDETGTERQPDVATEEHGEKDAEDAGAFMDALFNILRRKFREAINSSDEVTLLR
ncbi:hypothetical protein BDW62DRAFT_191004 [Aspergillus aurantiobrunneus]